MLMGRRSHEAFAPVWSTMMDDFAGYDALPRYVVSTMLARDDERWPATILLSLDAVATLKEGAGGPIIVHGSAADRDAVKLRVVEHTTYDNGIQMQVLDVVR